MDPNFVPAYGFLATVDNANGQLASAAGHLNKALELDPGHGRYFEDLAMIYIALGDFDAVRRVLDQVESTLGRNSVLFGRLAYFDLIAQARYGEAIEDLEELPENMRQRPIISWAFAMAYTLSGDYESAREHALVGAPYIADRDRWQHEIIDNNLALCEFAGAIHETGDDIGWELLQLLIQNYEANLSESKQGRDAAQFLVACYLAAGSYQQALDIIDRESADGRLIQGWWFTGKLPWWVHVEDDPRYREVVERMERQISEQRALLN